MAKRKSTSTNSAGGGHALVIVESPAKARTISKYLGRGFTVEASIGHVRDLPQGAKQIPAQYKNEPWSNLGVNVHEGFTPIYIIPPGKSKQIKAAQGSPQVGRRAIPGDRRRPRRGSH
jgi:DNA topoisomerase-1